MPISVESLSEKQHISDMMQFNEAGVYCLLSPSNSAHGKAFVRYSKNLYKLLKIAYSASFSDRNCYMTVNTLGSWHRDEHNVLGLNGLFIDVDCLKNGVSQGELLWYLHQILKLAKLPEPNEKIDSGHGVYLKWYFKKQVIIHNQCINRLWNKLERTIVDKFNTACKQVLGVKLGDSKATDSSRVLRIVNTWNVKAKPVQCRLIDYKHNARFDMFKDWVKDYLPVIRYRNRNKKRKQLRRFYQFKRNVNIKINKNGYTLNGFRMIDLKTWLKLHGYRINGKREEFLFIYACHAIHCENVKAVIRDINYLNDKLADPLPLSEIENLAIELTHVNIKKYHFKSKTIINKLGFTLPDQRHMKTLIGTQVNNRRYQKRLLERKNDRKIKRIKRNHAKAIRDDKVVYLHNHGKSLREISKIMKISRHTVIKAIRGGAKTRSLYSVLESIHGTADLDNIHIIYKNPRLLRYLSNHINNLIDVTDNMSSYPVDEALNNAVVSRIRDD